MFFEEEKEIINTNLKITRNPFLKRYNDNLLIEDIANHGFKYIRKLSKIFKLKLPKLGTTDDITFLATIYKNDAPSIYKNTYTIESILNYCIEPKTKLEIYNALFKSNKIDYTYFYDKYIIPLIESEALEYTIKDKPKSKYQKIKTNEEALKLLN